MTTKTTIRVEQYQFIDNLEHIIAPEERGSYYTDKVNDVKNAFLKNGWEGDGEIGLIWIPPFIENTGDTFGSYVWHVKQNNNGISFLGYEETEFFDNGFERNIKKFEEEHITVTYDNTRGCLDIINKYKTNLDSLIMFDKNIESQDELYHITLNAIQNNIVASFIDCIDEIYLNLLTHVFDSQNSDKLKLSKANVKLPLDEISKSDCEYIDSWLIIQQIESAIWRDFKFKPFKEKFREICSAVDFKCNEDLRKKIICHVEIRNSFQHHEGQLTSDMIKMVGQDHIDLLDESGKAKRFEKWNLIILSIPEVRSFCDSLEIFIRDYEQHIGTRMKDRHIRYKQNSIPVIESDNVNNEVAAESCNSEFVIKNNHSHLGAKNNDSLSKKQAIVKFYTMAYRKCGNFNSKNDSRPYMGASAILKSVDFRAFAVNVKTIARRRYLYQSGHAIWYEKSARDCKKSCVYEQKMFLDRN